MKISRLAAFLLECSRDYVLISNIYRLFCENKHLLKITIPLKSLWIKLFTESKAPPLFESNKYFVKASKQYIDIRKRDLKIEIYSTLMYFVFLLSYFSYSVKKLWKQSILPQGSVQPGSYLCAEFRSRSFGGTVRVSLFFLFFAIACRLSRASNACLSSSFISPRLTASPYRATRCGFVAIRKARRYKYYTISHRNALALSRTGTDL